MINAATILTEFSEYRVCITQCEPADLHSIVRVFADNLLRIHDQICDRERANIQLLSRGELTALQFGSRLQETFGFLRLWGTYAREAIQLGSPSEHLQELIDSDVIRLKRSEKAQELTEPKWDNEFIARQKAAFDCGQGIDVRWFANSDQLLPKLECNSRAAFRLHTEDNVLGDRMPQISR